MLKEVITVPQDNKPTVDRVWEAAVRRFPRFSPEEQEAGIESSQPDRVVVSLNSPQSWEMTSVPRLIVTACHFIFFFDSAESGRRWARSHPDVVLVPIEDAFTYGRRQNAMLFGGELARRASPTTAGGGLVAGPGGS